MKGYFESLSSLQEHLQKEPGQQTIGGIIGEFDLYNAWHLPCLEFAKERCELLVALLWEDEKIRQHHKGNPPYTALKVRAELLLGTQYVDYVLPVSELCEIVPNLRFEWLIEGGSGIEPLLNFHADLKSSTLKTDSVQPYFSDLQATQELLSRVRKTKSSTPFDEKFAKTSQRKVVSEKKIIEECKCWKEQSKKVVTTNGSFDILHLGHLRYLQQAKELGDLLIVLVNDDASITEHKGKDRPLFTQKERMSALAAFECVDYVVPFRGDNPLYLLKELHSDLHIKGGSYVEERIAQEKKVLESGGGQFVCLELIENFSTTHLVHRILQFE
ncbi:adenylyltransferase/cytidyltransferase family protein [Deltaproteobacteria bacterium TL4]